MTATPDSCALEAPRRGGAARRWLLGFGLIVSATLAAADLADAQRLARTGDYDAAVAAARRAVQSGEMGEEWDLLLANTLLAVGRYNEAELALKAGLRRSPSSIRLRWLGREVACLNGQPDGAAARVEEIKQLALTRMFAYRDPANMVAFGRLALLLGADAKDVLEKIYGVALKSDPKLRDGHLAKGELALEKHDYAIAAAAFQEALKQWPDDPDLLCGQARAYEESDRAQMLKSLEAALKINPRHVPSLLLLVDHKIDGEEYAEAEKLLERICQVNAFHPEARAYQAVLAHLRGLPRTADALREQALQPWPTNPRVDHLIGTKLSQKYRFAEGAEAQRRALAFDSSFLPAKAQLASDLLRLGDEEGWRLAQEVNKRDAYDVAAYNLVTLHDTMTKFATLKNDDFVVRMTEREARIYGPRVLELLGRAKRVLTAKYGFEVARPTIVEVFANQKDFGVRTFGLPDNPGYLGVCFGRVVTANGPAATAAHPVNWEAVLWHEFCHVVTLQATRNRMPRWLSEGISVYEELQQDPSWGQRMTPRYREMILGGELTPIGGLSAAFLAPKTPAHLQFAYFEASLVVEFLVARHGAGRLGALLKDLGEGLEINQALEKNAGSLKELEPAFAAFAKSRAEQLAPGLDWQKPERELLLPGSEEALAAWNAQHPDNYWALQQEGRRLVGAKKWSEARAVLERLIDRFPGQTGEDSACRPLAAVYRALGETDRERALLSRCAVWDDAAVDLYARLMELDAGAGDWDRVRKTAHRYLAVDPLVPLPYRWLAESAEKAGDWKAAIAACEVLLQLDPPNPAEVHFRLARLQHRTGEPAARRHLLQALEETPRDRAALRLLLEMTATRGSAPPPPPPGPSGEGAP
jgi:uncharacterized protein HemY